MRKRILAVTAAASLAVGTLAGPALAHFNEAAGTFVGPPVTPSGLGHAGMQCGAVMGSPNTPLQVFPGLTCPAQ